MLRISWTEKIKNEEMLIIQWKCFIKRQNEWISHIQIIHESLLNLIIDGNV